MGKFWVDVKYSGDVAVFQTKGYINDLGGEKIEKRCDDVLRDGYRKFIVNFDHSPIINSIGVSFLIGLIDRINRAKGTVYFTNLTMGNSEVLELMGLTKHAPIFKTEEDAFQQVRRESEWSSGQL
jgi:anti-anti-sigma factor